MRKHLFLSFLPIVIGVTVSFAQQKVNDGTITTGNLPNKDAILELESNNKGFLRTRVGLVRTTDAAPLTAHAAGMILINRISAQMLQ